MSDEYGQQYAKRQATRSRARTLGRRVYLRSAASLLSGPTLDVGCGVGDLLARLPAGSMGLEYNKSAVAHCQAKGLDVRWYDGSADSWGLKVVEPGRRFDSLVMSHVLEHFDDPMAVMASLLPSAASLGVRTALLIVPGRAGFKIDSTHRTFVDLRMLAEGAARIRWRVSRSRYFPINIRAAGDVFAHNELQVVYQL